MLRRLILVLLGCQMALAAWSQDPVFSQFFASPMQINPAFAGNTLEPRITLNYRNQWPALGKAYVTYAASYEQLIEPINSGLGIMVLTDNAGDGIYKTTRFSANYAYRLQVNRDFFIKFGMEAGMAQIALDWDQLVFLDQLDPIYGESGPNGEVLNSDEQRPVNTSKTYVDIGTGLLAYSNKFYFGLSAKHLNTPDESLLQGDANLNSGLPIRVTLHGGMQISKGGRNNQKSAAFISPNVMLIKQGDFGQINLGSYAGLGKFFAGAWYRHAWSNPDAVIALVGFQEGIFKVGYSYDVTVSNLAPGTGGAHEIAVTFNFDESESAKRRRRNNKYNDCFRMFR